MCAGDSTFIACKPLQTYEWKPIAGGGRRLFSPYPKNGVVVQVAAQAEYPDLAAFGRAILKLPLETSLEPTPRVRFRTLRGRNIDFTYGGVPSVNGTPTDYQHWPLFGGPFLEAAVDSERLVMKYGRMRRTLDFRALSITDTLQ